MHRDAEIIEQPPSAHGEEAELQETIIHQVNGSKKNALTWELSVVSG